jgi:hypothetical protein
MRIFDRVFRRLGVAITVLLSESLSQDRQIGPARIDLFVTAVARSGVEVGAATGAVPLAVWPAQWIQRQLERQGIAEHRLEIDLFGLHQVGVVLDRALVAGAGVELAYVHRKVVGELTQATCALEHHRRSDRTGDQDALDHALQPKLSVDGLLIDVSQGDGDAGDRRVDDDIPVLAGPSE